VVHVRPVGCITVLMNGVDEPPITIEFTNIINTFLLKVTVRIFFTEQSESWFRL